jgi:hypothetical protein
VEQGIADQYCSYCIGSSEKSPEVDYADGDHMIETEASSIAKVGPSVTKIIKIIGRGYIQQGE